jgi:hypothetical protein
MNMQIEIKEHQTKNLLAIRENKRTKCLVYTRVWGITDLWKVSTSVKKVNTSRETISKNELHGQKTSTQRHPLYFIGLSRPYSLHPVVCGL